MIIEVALSSFLSILPNATKYTNKLDKNDPTKQNRTVILRKKYGTEKVELNCD